MTSQRDAFVRKLFPLMFMGLAVSGLSGCALFAAAGAGYAVGDEVSEGDGEFDVLEDVRGVEDGSN